MKFITKIMIITGLMLSVATLSSCSTKIKNYENSTPTIDIKTYFNGPVVAWGMVQDYTNQVTRRFCVEIQGSWQDDSGLLAEKFYFNDGEVSYRNWQLIRHSQNNYSGSAEDVIGVAKGVQAGFALQWQYQLSVKINETDYVFTLDDWMYRIDDYRVFNKTQMKKFGVPVAEITLFFDKELPIRKCTFSS